MKELKENKQLYITPEITCVKLDNEISLALESDPPFLPGEEVYNADPFKLNHSDYA